MQCTIPAVCKRCKFTDILGRINHMGCADQLHHHHDNRVFAAAGATRSMEKCQRIGIGVFDTVVVQRGYDTSHLLAVTVILETVVRNERCFDRELCH